MAKKRQVFRKHSPEFKLSVILDMRNNYLGYRETARKYDVVTSVILKWERIFLEEGEAGFYIERRGRTTKMDNPNKGKKKNSLPKNIKQDLISQNQLLKEENEYLKAEIEYLKKLDALVRAEEQKKSKKH